MPTPAQPQSAPETAPAPAEGGDQTPVETPATPPPVQDRTAAPEGFASIVDRLDAQMERNGRGAPRPEAAQPKVDAQAAPKTDAPVAPPEPKPEVVPPAEDVPDLRTATRDQLAAFARKNPSHPLASYAQAEASRMSQSTRDQAQSQAQAAERARLFAESQREYVEEQRRIEALEEEALSDDLSTRLAASEQLLPLKAEQRRRVRLLRDPFFLGQAGQMLLQDPMFLDATREVMKDDPHLRSTFNALAWNGILDGIASDERLAKAVGKDAITALGSNVSSVGELVTKLADALYEKEHKGWISPKQLKEHVDAALEDARTRSNGHAARPDVGGGRDLPISVGKSLDYRTTDVDVLLREGLRESDERRRARAV